MSLKTRLREILIRDNMISAQDFEWALDEQKKSGEDFSQVLIKLRLIDENVLTEVLSKSLGIPTIPISRLTIDPKIIKVIPKEIAEKHKIIPISVIGNNLTVAMSDPLNIFVIDSIKTLTGFDINPIIGSATEINTAIQKYYYQENESSATEQFDTIMKEFQDTGDIEIISGFGGLGKDVIEQLTDEAPIIKLTDTIIQQAVFAKASDVFIEPLEGSVRVRYRIDGVIREIDRMPKVLNNPIVSRIKVISNLDISEHRLPQDGRFKSIVSGNKEVDFRVSVLPTALGEKICLRILDQNASVASIDHLGFDAKSLERLKECAAKPHGMILTCGPTGSGKTTTLYSILKLLNSPECNIITVEDPVEFQMKGLNQVNIKASMGLTFSVSLRSILRQDPDIIMIGEIRDTETLDIAVKAALTGHLVLSSLHTTTASGSIIRMMNMGIEPFLICSSVLAIVAQRLLRRICTKCKESYTLAPDVAQKVGLGKMIKNKETILYRGKGCKACFNLGYQGRVGITVVFIFSPSVKEKILNRVGEFKIKEAARKEGMITMREDGLTKALQGLTTLEEVLRVTAPDENIEEEKS